jgi:hypothetical protein
MSCTSLFGIQLILSCSEPVEVFGATSCVKLAWNRSGSP